MKVKNINKNILIELKETQPENYINFKEKYPEIDLWIKGKDYPTYNQLLELSKEFDIGFSCFFLEKLPKKHIPKKIYLSGSIINDPDYYNKFNYWKKVLKDKFPNADIINPIDFIKIENITEKEKLASFIIQSLNLLKECTDIYIIPENKEDIIKDIEANFAECLCLNFIFEI
jgi:hypothetical protein